MHIHWSITKTVIYDTFLESRGLALSFVHVKLFIKAISNKDESYISVHSDLSRPILVRPSSENHSSSEGLRSARSDAP